MAFAPNNKFAYSVNELKSTATAFTFDAARGILKPFQTLSTLPKDFTGHNDTAEIHVSPNGKFVYASNRGHDSIAQFSIDAKSGRLTLMNNFPIGGKTPRDFELDPAGTHLLVAGQDSNNVVVFKIAPETGALTQTGQTVSVPAPALWHVTKLPGLPPLTLASVSVPHATFAIGADPTNAPSL